jgi:ribosome modulation factor
MAGVCGRSGPACTATRSNFATRRMVSWLGGWPR